MYKYKILTMNKISKAGTDLFDQDFVCTDQCENPEAIMVRSASLHEIEFPESLRAIARAGAGVNNIPIDKCSEKGIVVFNTPGANANAVKELVIAGLLLSSRRVYEGITWAAGLKGKGDEVGKLVEKNKNQFVGPEIKGKTLGVVGLGAIGVLVANAAKSLGMNVVGVDPFLSVDTALKLSRSVKLAKSLKEVFECSDYISLHVPLNNETRNYINTEAISSMKDGVRILNFARAELVNDQDLVQALSSGKVSCYVTDFPTDAVIGVKGVIAIPHLGASTPESEENCAEMAAKELIEFFKNGSIINSVNFPSIEVNRAGDVLVCIIHRNIPSVLSKISSTVSAEGVNIENMNSKSKKDYAYTVLDITGSVSEESISTIKAIDGVIRVWTIK